MDVVETPACRTCEGVRRGSLTRRQGGSHHVACCRRDRPCRSFCICRSLYRLFSRSFSGHSVFSVTIIGWRRRGGVVLGPVKFAALAITISNLVFPMFLALGVQAGAVSPDYVAFAEWAEEQGYLEPLGFTGIGILDDVSRDLLRSHECFPLRRQ